MPNHILIENKIGKFNKSIFVSGDKSISIKWVLFASLASGISKAKNLLVSEDVLAAIDIIKKFPKNVFLTPRGGLARTSWLAGHRCAPSPVIPCITLFLLLFFGVVIPPSAIWFD